MDRLTNKAYTINNEQEAIRELEIMRKCFKSFSVQYQALSMAIEALAIPTAEPKTGHWEEVGEEYIQVYDLNGIPSCGDERICSECGFETVFIGEHCSQYKFCPNCGAKMVEPQEVRNKG